MTGFEHCQFFVERKKRYCRMTVKKGRNFCGEHQFSNDASKKIIDERINCPLDPTHTCYKSKLSKHLKVCNAKIVQDKQPKYIVKGINLGIAETCINNLPLSEIDQAAIDIVISKIKNSYDKLPHIFEEILKHEVLEKELTNSIYGIETKRHLIQTASLLGHLVQADLVQDNTCFIEFGAGRGKLTYWLGQVIKDQANSSIILIDRSTVRHKKDNKLKNEHNGIKVMRVRADIADLKLNDVPEINEKQCEVAIAKHICGSATDLTLRCIKNSIESKKKSKVGVIIAFCCHHRCDYSQYVGHKYLTQEGFLKNEFPLLCKIASWATCGMKNEDVNQIERENLGGKVKTLLNWGRLQYLNEHGFTCRLVKFVSTDTTLENMCIIATHHTDNNELNFNEVNKK